MGSRSAEGEALREWVAGAAEGATGGDDRLGERIQAAFFVCGDDEAAKAQVSALLEAFG